MIFHENRLQKDDSHEMSYLIFRKFGKMSNISSAAVVIVDCLTLIARIFLQTRCFKKANNMSADKTAPFHIVCHIC